MTFLVLPVSIGNVLKIEIMERVFYGVSMGLINSNWNQRDSQSSGNYFSHIMKRLVREFRNVEAELMMEGVGSRLTEEEESTILADKGFVIFSFRKSQYFSDVQKTAELIIEDVARELLNYSERFTDEVERLLMIKNFKMCFRPYCIERRLSTELSNDQVVEILSHTLEDTVNKGRGIPMASKPSLVEFLSEDPVRRAYASFS